MAAKSVGLFLFSFMVFAGCKPRSTLSDAERNRRYYEREFTEETIFSSPAVELPRRESHIAIKSWIMSTYGNLTDNQFKLNAPDVRLYGRPLKLWSWGQQNYPFLSRNAESGRQEILEYDFEIQFQYNGKDSFARQVFSRPFRYQLMAHAAPRVARIFQIMVEKKYYENNPQNQYDKKCLALRLKQSQSLGKKDNCKQEEEKLNGISSDSSQNARMIRENNIKTTSCCFASDAITQIQLQPFSWATETAGEENPFFVYHAALHTLSGGYDDPWRLQLLAAQKNEAFKSEPNSAEGLPAPSNFAGMMGGQKLGTPYCEQFNKQSFFSELSRSLNSKGVQGPPQLPGFGNLGLATKIASTRALGFIPAEASRILRGQFDLRVLDLMAPLSRNLNAGTLAPEYLRGHIDNITALHKGLPEEPDASQGGAGSEQQAQSSKTKRNSGDQNILADGSAYNL